MTDNLSTEIIHRQFDTESDEPAVQVAEAVADIEDKAPNELSTMYECVDGMLTELFSSPPAQGAQMQVEFSYEGYRITLGQDGVAELIKTA